MAPAPSLSPEVRRHLPRRFDLNKETKNCERDFEGVIVAIDQRLSEDRFSEGFQFQQFAVRGDRCGGVSCQCWPIGYPLPIRTLADRRGAPSSRARSRVPASRKAVVKKMGQSGQEASIELIVAAPSKFNDRVRLAKDHRTVGIVNNVIHAHKDGDVRCSNLSRHTPDKLQSVRGQQS